MKSGKLRMAVAIAAGVATCSVVLPSCSSSGVTNRTASASRQACAWPTASSIQTSDTGNVGIPDSAASYWAQPIVASSATRIVISGTYPDARYASLSVYTPYGSPFTVDGVSSSLPDYKIAPEHGSSNPWRAHASAGGKFEVTMRSDVSSGQTNVLPLPPGTTAKYPGYLVYRVYLPAGGVSRVKLPTLTMDKGSATDKLSTCTVHPNFVLAPEKAPVTTTTSSAVASPGAALRAGEFYKPAFAGGYANADGSYVQAFFGRPAAADVMVVTGKAPTHVPGEDPSPWPGPDDDMRYWSMCIGIGVANEPTVVNHLAGGKTDYGCRADQETKVDAAGDYTYVIGTEAQRAAISRIPDVTFLPFSTSQTSRLYVLLLRNLLVSSHFPNSVQNVVTPLGATATSVVMGQYYPTVSTCPLATLAAHGVQGC